MAIGVEDKGQDVEIRSGSLSVVKKIEDTVKTDIVSGEVLATVGTVEQVKSGSIEVTGGTVNTQIDNLNYAGTVNVVNSIANPVTSDVGSGTRPTSLQTDNIGLFKTSDFTETRTISTDNVGLAKDTTLKSGTVNAVDTVNEVRSGTVDTVKKIEGVSEVKSGTVSLSGTPSVLPSPELQNRSSLVIYNRAGIPVYVGGSNVTTSNGIELPADGKLAIDSEKNLYGVAGSAVTVNVMELR